MIAALLTLINSLPEILKLIQALQEAQAKSEADRKMKEDLAKLTNALKDEDAKALHDIFNS